MKATGVAFGIDDWFLSRSALWVAAGWGFAEGTVFFFIPDIFLTATALFSVRRSLSQMFAALAGSLVGGTLLFGLAAHNPASAENLVQRVPFVSHRMFDKVEHDFQDAGVWALCKGPTSGIPYKVYAVQAPHHTQIVSFLLVSVPARLERFVLSWAIFALIGVLLRGKIQAHPVGAVGLHALYWIGVYAYYWSAVAK
jgi:membrane protein YqaA with SNARE-associated domain